LAAYRAAVVPAGPPPTTIRSNFRCLHILKHLYGADIQAQFTVYTNIIIDGDVCLFKFNAIDRTNAYTTATEIALVWFDLNHKSLSMWDE
jgi:hypothetical protein